MAKKTARPVYPEKRVARATHVGKHRKEKTAALVPRIPFGATALEKENGPYALQHTWTELSQSKTMGAPVKSCVVPYLHIRVGGTETYLVRSRHLAW